MLPVLVISCDPMIGEVVRELVAYAGYRPVSPCADERLSDALRRVRPAVVLVDGEHATGCSEGFLASAASADTPVVFFADACTAPTLRELALQRGAKFFTVSKAPRLLRQTLARAVGE